MARPKRFRSPRNQLTQPIFSVSRTQPIFSKRQKVAGVPVGIVVGEKVRPTPMSGLGIVGLIRNLAGKAVIVAH